MNKDPNVEKQIEELARSFCGLSKTLKCSECSYECYQKEYAKKAFEAGYRKASEVVAKIFAEIIEALTDERITEDQKANSALEAQDTASYEVYSYAEDKLATIVLALELYKKKYTEEEK